MHPTLNIDTVASTGPRTVLRITGALDMDTVPDVSAATDPLALNERTLALDLSNVTFMDSSGLNTLLNLRNRIQAEHGALELQGAPEQVLRLLEITGARDLFTLIHARPDEARESA
ncbi:STAS domain-containing protein [Streptomyces sp. NPDC002886]|uniref:STAS domain-containing protein n=1 Tax=Streptomyces sp. NPDC002886 TaxID=3364667 RepID=UPI0036A72C23